MQVPTLPHSFLPPFHKPALPASHLPLVALDTSELVVELGRLGTHLFRKEEQRRHEEEEHGIAGEDVGTGKKGRGGCDRGSRKGTYFMG